ncbi:type VII secretion-associated serine protease mycosin [Stackebrandtia albiflava]|uniref:Type VII secretion-associated serine protease mycosin n=1 Tax=Stackebrandtia albiflava TaxID=406432 RepID=A0A562VBZ2_9ACTN|nr:type VII secretion-associated serine protease mycosin [Stackebrandtia albiflava]TWJ15405.1 type VII secretion-associated serine protease mycosin [Stackebrandtia albiflava]
MRGLRSLLLATLLGTTAALAVAAPASAADCEPLTRESELDHVPWGQRRLAPERVWPFTTGEGVTVAVIDSGVSDSHEVLAGKVSVGENLVDDDLSAGCDLVGHGTSIAGIIAGRTASDSPFTGMAPEADILSIRVMPDLRPVNGEEIPARLATAIRQAVDAGADVINLSIQVSHAKVLENAVAYAADNDVVLVAAAGNRGGEDGDNRPQYPAAYDEDALLAVTAVDPEGRPTETSNSGDYLDLAAPGVEIVGPGPEGDGYTGGEAATGTSFATAFVSGTAALLRARFPDATAAQLTARMIATAEHPAGAWNPQVGFGMVDPYRAVTTDLGHELALEDEARPPVLRLRADTQAWPSRVATGMLVGTLASVTAIGAGRGVVTRIRRRKAIAGG